MAAQAHDGPLQAGSRFLEKYEINEPLGRGGQAWVYRGTHLFTGREVAIKVVHSSFGVTRDMLERGKSEARALGKLEHPNIVALYDAGLTDDGLFYLVMELLRGCTLRAALVAHQRLEVEEVLRLGIQAGEAVQAAHASQTIHRDLKPDNIFLMRDNRLKVLDFGIAKMLDEIGFTTRKQGVAGTLLYMSPEQAQGMSVTARSDIFALGVILFEAMLGKHPTILSYERKFAGCEERRAPGLADLAELQVNSVPPLLSELDARIPPYVAQVVHRAMAKLPSQRFASMTALVATLQAALEKLTQESRESGQVIRARDLSLPIDRPQKASLVSVDDEELVAPNTEVIPTKHDAAAPQHMETAPLGTRVDTVGEAQGEQRARALSAPATINQSAPTMPRAEGPAPLAASAAPTRAAPRSLPVAQVTTRIRSAAIRETVVAASMFGAAVGGAVALFQLTRSAPASASILSASSSSVGAPPGRELARPSPVATIAPTAPETTPTAAVDTGSAEPLPALAPLPVASHPGPKPHAQTIARAPSAASAPQANGRNKDVEAASKPSDQPPPRLKGSIY